MNLKVERKRKERKRERERDREGAHNKSSTNFRSAQLLRSYFSVSDEV